MSWQELKPTAGSTGSMREKSPIAMSARKRALHVVIWPRLIEGLDWLRDGGSVGVELGVGEHAGLLRITPGGRFKLGRTGGPKQDAGVATERVLLVLPRLPGMADGRHQPMPLTDWDNGDGWLEITLPGWATAPKVVAARPPLPVVEAAPFGPIVANAKRPQTVLVDRVDAARSAGRPLA